MLAWLGLRRVADPSLKPFSSCTELVACAVGKKHIMCTSQSGNRCMGDYKACQSLMCPVYLELMRVQP